MKQLQWEKVSKAQVAKTVWSTSETVDNDENEIVNKMKAVNLWSEMEDEFKAKEIIYDAVKKRKETELLSVLGPDHRKRIEILMAGSTAKSFKAPEKLSEAIANFNTDLCTETFLRELQGVLPSDEDVSLMLFYSQVPTDVSARQTCYTSLRHGCRTRPTAPGRSAHGQVDSASSLVRPRAWYALPGRFCSEP